MRIKDSQLENKLFVERIKLLYLTGNGALLGVFVVSLLLSISLWFAASDTKLWWWMIVLTAVIIFRAVTIRIFNQSEHHSYYFWASIYVIGVVLSGALWGAAGWVFIDAENLITVVILITFTLGISAGAATSISIFYPAFFGFIISAILPLSIRLFIEGELFVSFGAAVLFYIVASALFARQYHNTISESLTLRFENIDLITKITAEKELVEKEKLIAEDANIAKSKFLAATSHDLRQPLHALGLLVSTLESTSDPKLRAEILSHIKESVSALEDLFNSLLDISRLDAGIVEISREDISLKELFEHLKKEFMLLAPQRDVEIRFVSTSHVVFSDSVLLKRILRNIISNSIRYTKHGKVLIGVRSNKNKVAIYVLDQGIGIPDDELMNVFSEFNQLHNPERDRSKGLGLGLAIVKRLCDLLGHQYELKSVFGKGSCFRITLPKGNRKNISLHHKDTLNMFDNFDQFSILVIDDEKAVLDSMKMILTEWGCKVIIADSIGVAVNQVKSNQLDVDLIISDYRLRNNSTGIEAIESVRNALSKQVKGILVTGDTSEEILKTAKDSEFPLLHKPVNAAQLKMAIIKSKEN